METIKLQPWIIIVGIYNDLDIIVVEEKIFVNIRGSFLVMMHNTVRKKCKQLCTNTEVDSNITTYQNEHFVRDVF